MTEQRKAHPYHMHDSILGQPERVERLLRTQREPIERAAERAAGRKRILFVGIGTSLHAALVGERMLRRLTDGRALAGVEQSFELVGWPLALGPEDAVVLTSHRGWKNYSVEALKAARAAGALTVAITGENGGEGMQAADVVVTTCEQEKSFAHTKSYTTALVALALFAARLADRRGTLAVRDAETAIMGLPALLREALGAEDACRRAAAEIARRDRWLFAAAGPNWVTAHEGALKVKETSYLAAEGFQSEQFLHGPIAEADQRAAMTAILSGGTGDERTRAVLRAVGELGVLRTAVAARGVTDVPAEHTVEAPAAPPWLSPAVLVVPLQFLSYYVALARGTNPDTAREDQPAHARAKQHYQL